MVHFQPHLAPDILNMRGSVIHLKKILMNLAGNAAQAIESEGTVTMTTTNCYLDTPKSIL